jgi:apolipoprotein N-acyltransferase
LFCYNHDIYGSFFGNKKNRHYKIGGKMVKKILCVLLFPLMCFISGIMVGFSYPKIDMFYLVWFALIPLLFVIKNSSPLKSLLYGWFTGFAASFITFFWFLEPYHSHKNVGALGFFVLLFAWAYLGFYMGVWAFAVNLMNKYLKHSWIVLLASVVLWVSLDYVKTYFSIGFPWGVLGYTQHSFTSIIQISEWTSVFGVSALIVLFNYALFLFLTNLKNIRGYAYLLAISLIMAGVHFVGSERAKKFSDFGEEPLKAILVQPRYTKLADRFTDETKKNKNMYYELKTYILADMRRRAERFAELKPDLIVWPENTVQRPRKRQGEQKKLMSAIYYISSISGSLNLIGVPAFTSNWLPVNSVMAFSGKSKEKKINSHLKNELAAFGEYFPYKKFFDVISARVRSNYEENRIYKGSDANVFSSGGIKAGSMICAENLNSEMARRFVGNGAKVLVSQSNDAWSADSDYKYQHFAANVFRAIETRKDVLVSANTGVTGFIGADGKIKKVMKTNTGGSLTGFFRQNDYVSFYVSNGNLFAKICNLFSIILLICFISLLVKFARKASENDEAFSLSGFIRRFIDAAKTKKQN